jgi:hypothetical protein
MSQLGLWMAETHRREVAQKKEAKGKGKGKFPLNAAQLQSMRQFSRRLRSFNGWSLLNAG